jgi:hypothetical protein
MEFPQGKYANTITIANGVFRVSWTNTQDEISIGIKAKTKGWVGIAFSPNLSKSNSDLIIGFASDNQAVLVDSFNPGYSGSHPQDGVAGGKNDLYDISGSEIDGITTIEFKRKLVTGDSFDVPLVKGDNPFLIAIGDGKDIGAYHSLVSFGKIVII